MTPLQFPKKLDYSSPEYKKQQREQQINFHLHQLGRLLDERKALDEKIATVNSALATLRGQD